MFSIVDDFNSPSHRIRSNHKWRLSEFPRRRTKLFGFSRFNLRSQSPAYDGRDYAK
ncbi:hypothetical protein BDM02DRAFT_3113168 [Thelephora ganbajun]|uniref:Uncharacterized protein n=1 Tax=Thelephora ganbajun TaxID=370292 RepID=A0ACB6ZIV7_THEGA|nr:hypothetical protein BDM02DRAFT_3113168 [Thelephora ganbajun]